MMARALSSALVIFVFMCGCAHVDVGGEWEGVGDFSDERVGVRPVWERSKEDSAYIQKEVDSLLTDGLTEREAVAIAILNNRGLQASFEDIGIAKADLVQAGLFTNPHLGLLFRFPFGGGGMAAEAEGLFNIADFWQIPVKRQIASRRLEEATLAVSAMVLGTAAEAKEAYLNYSSLSLELGEAENIRDEMAGMRDRIIYRQGFGYSSDLDIKMADAALLSEEIEVSRLGRELRAARSRLNRVLGLSASQTSYTVSGDRGVSPEFPAGETDKLMAYAMSRRPDVNVFGLRAEEARRRLRLEKARVVYFVEAGAAYSHEADGTDALGPALGIQIPIFDQNRANIARAEYSVRKTEKELEAKAGEVLEEVSVLLDGLSVSREEADRVRAELVPLREGAVEYAEKYFNAMELDMLYLIEAKRALFEARLRLIRAEREARLLEIKLERALGGTLPQTP